MNKVWDGLNTVEGDLGMNFILTCAGCKLSIGSSTKLNAKDKMYCGVCAEKMPVKSAEEVKAMQEKSRKDFMNRVFAQVGSPLRLK